MRNIFTSFFFKDWLKASEALVLLGSFVGLATTVIVFLCACVDNVDRNKLAHVVAMQVNFVVGKLN